VRCTVVFEIVLRGWEGTGQPVVTAQVTGGCRISFSPVTRNTNNTNKIQKKLKKIIFLLLLLLLLR
jgi:hypothetical protein